MTTTAAEAYKRTMDSVNYGSTYGEDHRDILLDIEDACDDGQYGCDFSDEDFDDMEKHMEDLKKNGFDVIAASDEYGKTYSVSWAKQNPA